MHVPVHKPVAKYSVNMTPMIDVVFLLIIFFLVSSHLSKQETNPEIPLPVASSGQEDASQVNPRVTINVTTDGSLTLAGRPIRSADLANKLTSLRAEHGQDMEVRIRGSRQSAYSVVEPIMLACARSQIWNVTYSVYREAK